MFCREAALVAAEGYRRALEAVQSRTYLPQSGAPPGRVLIVEDEIESMLELSEWFQSKGIEFLAETDPSEALNKALYDEQIGIAVVDAYLGRMSGYELIAEIKAHLPPDRLMKFILITGHPTRQDYELATRLGITDFLEKPLDLKALERALLEGYEYGCISADHADGSGMREQAGRAKTRK